jgi:hypothetical protein
MRYKDRSRLLVDHTNNTGHQGTSVQDQATTLDAKVVLNQESKMSTPRFVDGTIASADLLNDLLQTYMPLAVDWTIGPVSCTFQLTCLTVRVENGAGMPLTASSDTMPRRYLDPLRQALRDILHAALSEPTWSTMGFGVMLLQMGEEALLHVEAFQKTSQAQLDTQHQQRPQE